MNILVVDVAAQVGGAVTVLDSFINEFKNDVNNKYTVLLSTLDREDAENVHFIKIPFVKKSIIHRIYFDLFYVKKLSKKIKPDFVLSLQNKTVSCGKIPQDVFFHNALPITKRRFSFKESRKLWMYQNVYSFAVKKSLKKARNIYVQAEWIKKALNLQWNIAEDKIHVKRPVADMPIDSNLYQRVPGMLFYPANGSVYKNHATLLQACTEIWDEHGIHCGLSLHLTLPKESLPLNCLKIIDKKDYPIIFTGRLNKEQMIEMYQKSILVFPSYIETVGLPLAEARALNSPIIAADCEYAHEIIGEYDNVSYFEPLDYKSLKNLILRMFKSHE